ncbi:MAG: hypothetical protein OXB92_01300 [Acidimicrobiaceae bacterium]|nr:hypothetical protein [Acidimicrobiia bacterium]MCY4492477.1 hypothetical protein [Acidimicrobiaceae bacterium]
MTDPTHPNDEIVSSYIDGEATLDEVARVQASPELLAEVRDFEAVAELVSTPVAPLAQSDVEELIGRALDQSDNSSQVIDLAAVRAIRTFNPQRLATIAATLIILAGAVGAVIMFNSAGDDNMTASTAEMADEYFAADSDDMADDSDAPADSDTAADDGDMAASGDMSDDSDAPADSGMADDGDMAEAMPEESFEVDSDAMAAAEETDAADDFELGGTDDQAEATTTVAAVTTHRGYRLIQLEIAESYETLDELIEQATERWRDLVATDFAGSTVPEDTEGDEPTQQALVATPCGESLFDFMHAMPEIDGADTLRVSETAIDGIPVTVAVLPLTGDHPADTAALLTASEPTCTVEQLTTLSP